MKEVFKCHFNEEDEAFYALDLMEKFSLSNSEIKLDM